MIKVSYLTNLPREGYNPKVTITEDANNSYFVTFTDRKTGEIVTCGSVNSNGWVSAMRQWYTDWRITVYKGKEKIYTEDLDLTGKIVFIKCDAKALGDNIAWIPYLEEFRIKHNCIVIGSTFFNFLFAEEYPNIIFIDPWTIEGKIDDRLKNVYAQYYIGTLKPDNYVYSPRPYGKIKMQETPSDILGLEYKEIKAKIKKPNVIKTRSVCISEKGSSPVKEWNGNWQIIVDYLVSRNYEVKVISKEPTSLKNVTDKTGDFPLTERIKDLCESEFFIGVSSGLSWLAHSCDTYVFIVSDHTPPDHEFKENCTRIYSDKCRKEVIPTFVDGNITSDQIIDAISSEF